MRPHLEFVDTKSMPWVPRGTGAYTKLLSTDPVNGARTALQRVVPTDGAKAPSVPHYHYSDEEILVLKGRLTFDSKMWFGELGYCFHPAYTVHGFKSAVPEETWFLSRHSQKMETFQIPKPKKRKYYSIAENPSPRNLVALPDARVGLWEDRAVGFSRTRVGSVELGRNPVTGEGTRLFRLRPGYAQEAGATGAGYEEIFVLDGAIELEGGGTFDEGGYSFLPPKTKTPAFTSLDGALLYVNFGPG